MLHSALFANIIEKLQREAASVWPLLSLPNENFAAFSVAMQNAERLPQFFHEQGLTLQLLNQAHSANYASCYAKVPASADAWLWPDAITIEEHSQNLQNSKNIQGKNFGQNFAGYSAFGIYTADCVPVLLRMPLYAKAATGRGALMHLGRRGIEQRLLEKCFRALVNMPPMPPIPSMPPAKTESGSPKTKARKVQIRLGPSIGPCCYEVPTALAEEFCRRAGVSALCRKPKPKQMAQKREKGGKQMLDLALAIREQAEQALGLAAALQGSRLESAESAESAENIPMDIQMDMQTIGPCTSCQAQRYQSNPQGEAVCYSYRRGHKRERIYTFMILPNPQKPAR